MKQQNLSESYANTYEHYTHSIGTMMLHLEWCTKYRYKMFGKEENRKLLEACIRRAATMHEIKILELNVQPEHVHCVVQVKFTFSASYVLQMLKGISSRFFFLHQEKARLRYPRGHLWSRGNFASSVGFTNVDVVSAYVRNQDEHHQTYR